MTANNTKPTLLEHAKRVVQRRKVVLGDLLSGVGLRWAVFLTHGYLYHHDGEREVRGFADLGIAHDGDVEHLFSQIRDSGELLEGERRLPAEIISILLESAGSRIWVRNSELPMPLDLGGFEEVVRAADPDFEFEACADSGAWYMRFRDDDAAIFIAARVDILDKVVAASPDCVLPVGAGFLYAR